jgi:hypothetical protein
VTEATTSITDCILAVCAAFWALQLFRRDRPWFALAFAVTAVGALAGAAWHGGFHSFVIWKTTLVSIGIASFALGTAAATAWLSRPARIATMVLLAIQFVWYISIISRSDDFSAVVNDYGLVMIAILIGCAIRFRDSASPWLAAGIVVSFVAAGVQASSLRLGPLDHNGIYHLIEIGGLWLLYRGGVRLTSRPAVSS